MPRRTAAHARNTRDAIVGRAVDVASLEGLEGITIGRLATDLRMSKAGVIGHFGSKEALQLAALDAASEVFLREVWERAAEARPGRERLETICDAWVDYLARGTFPGGCFLTAASTEFDGREGPVRDAVSETLALWNRVLEREAATAIADGDLPRETDPADVAFAILGAALALNQAVQLHRDANASDRARRLMAAALAR
jgi:AcrR family transcriptional regulator